MSTFVLIMDGSLTTATNTVPLISESFKLSCAFITRSIVCDRINGLVNEWTAKLNIRLPNYVTFKIGEDGSKNFSCPHGMMWTIRNYISDEKTINEVFNGIIYRKDYIKDMVSTAWKDFVSDDYLVTLIWFINKNSDNYVIYCNRGIHLGELLVSFDFDRLLNDQNPAILRSAKPNLMTIVTSNPVVDKFTLCSCFMYEWTDKGELPKEITELILRELYLSYI